MLFNETTFIGIDPTAGKRPMAYAALDQDLRVLALDKGNFDEITAFVGGQQAAFVAVNSPRQPNQGLMKRDEVREKLKPVPRPGRWLGYRVAEYLLRQHNIHIMRTCSEVKKCPNWMPAILLPPRPPLRLPAPLAGNTKPQLLSCQK